MATWPLAATVTAVTNIMPSRLAVTLITERVALEIIQSLPSLTSRHRPSAAGSTGYKSRSSAPDRWHGRELACGDMNPEPIVIHWRGRQLRLLHRGALRSR